MSFRTHSYGEIITQPQDFRAWLHVCRVDGRDRHHRHSGWRRCCPPCRLVREAARRNSCSNNLSQLALALCQYEMAHRKFPPGTVEAEGPILNQASGYHHNWILQLLPYLEQRTPTVSSIDR